MASDSKRPRAAAVNTFSVPEEIKALIAACVEPPANNHGEPNSLNITAEGTASEVKTPEKIDVDPDFYSLFSDPISTKKSRTSVKRKLVNETPTSSNEVPKEKPNQRPAILAARRALHTPLFGKWLDAGADSPCSPLGKPLSSPGPLGNTPLPHTVDLFKTPSTPSGQRGFALNGEPPLSGVKALINDGGSVLADKSPILMNNTPAGMTAVQSCLHPWPWPMSDEDFEEECSILSGVTCYVEVRLFKRDAGGGAKHYMEKFGAKVEKNFTKKVTLVIFKEGKISTYMKAKELKIPIVSASWIVACKLAGGFVDPALYPPLYDEVYQKNMPIAEEKRRERLLRRGQEFLDRLNGILPPKPPRSRTIKKKEASVTEKKKEAKGSRAESKGPKKLNFIDDNPNNIDTNSSKTDSDEKPTKDNGRRKSAPADLGDNVTGQQKLAKFFQPVAGSSNDDRATPPSQKSQSQTTSSKRNKRVLETKRPVTARKFLKQLMEQEEDASPSKSTSPKNSLA